MTAGTFHARKRRRATDRAQFYSETFGEWFHNCKGSRQQAQTINVEASG
jgi:hypothetical protein